MEIVSLKQYVTRKSCHLFIKLSNVIFNSVDGCVSSAVFIYRYINTAAVKDVNACLKRDLLINHVTQLTAEVPLNQSSNR